MNQAENNITQQLTGKPSLKEVSIEALQQLTEHYSYFSAAHYLFSKKLKQENNPGFLPTVQKTVLYFSNPHWLHYQLMQDDKTGEATDVIQQEATEDAVINVENLPFSEEKHKRNNEDIKDDADEETHSLQEEVVLKGETETPQNEKEAQNDKAEIIESEENNKLSEDINSATQLITEPELPPLDEEEKIEHVTTVKEEEQSNTRLSEILDEQAKEFNKPVDEHATLPIISEPYHTIDYFVSQGIKLEQQEQHQPGNNLDTKVRRFTDWLKQMKRISPQPSDLGTTTEMESAVEKSANISNEPKEVITEAMAEVLLKQGKMDKAIELYMKLSFLNPEKTAYFAAKIQNLKSV